MNNNKTKIYYHNTLLYNICIKTLDVYVRLTVTFFVNNKKMTHLIDYITDIRIHHYNNNNYMTDI